MYLEEATNLSSDRLRDDNDEVTTHKDLLLKECVMRLSKKSGGGVTI